MVKTHSNFMVKHTFLWAKLIFLCSDLANFLGQSSFHSSDNFMLRTYSIPMTRFYAQNLFHFIFMLHSSGISDRLLKASHAFLLTCGDFRKFEPSLETATKCNTSPTV